MDQEKKTEGKQITSNVVNSSKVKIPKTGVTILSVKKPDQAELLANQEALKGISTPREREIVERANRVNGK